MLLKASPSGNLDIDDPDVFREYYRCLYSFSRPEEQCKELEEAIRLQDFPEVAKLYRVIPNDAVNVLVPYDKDIFRNLADEVRENGLNADWIGRARLHSVSVYRPGRNSPLADNIEAVPLKNGDVSEDWFIYLQPKHYERDLGLVAPDSWDINIA
jgi:hypothetical protein